MSLIASQSGRSAAGGARFWPRVPPSFSGIPFGLAGLAEAWDAASATLGTPAAVPDDRMRPAGHLGIQSVVR
jgi:hypothetical protein